MAARLAYSNCLLASSVAITSSADATGYPAANLANPARWKKWRSSTTTGDQWVLFDLGSAVSFQLLAVTDVLLHTGGGTLKAQANATNVWTAPTVNDTLTLASPDFTHLVADWLASVQTLRFIRFFFQNVGASNSFVEIGAAFAGTYVQPSQAIAPGLSLARVDLSVPRYAIGGERSTVVRPKYHVITASFPLTSVAERDALRAAFDANGIGVPCVFAVDSTDPSLQFYGTLGAEGGGASSAFTPAHHKPSANLWDVPILFTEDVA